MRFDGYDLGGFYDEMFERESEPRAVSSRLLANIESLPEGEILNRQLAAERELLQMGITFNVYGQDAGVEKIFPFDIVPRIIGASEWNRIERGLKQRIRALNLFIDDVYHEQNILREGVIPPEIVYSAKSYRLQCAGWEPPRGIWCHITGTDLVRHQDGQLYVLEDNLRCPSGVSYVLENRRVMKGLFPKIFSHSHIQPVSILSCLQAARENARGVREVLSSDMWLQLNKSYLMVREAAGAPPDLDLAAGFFHKVKLASHLFTGITDATMTHGVGWHFCQAGRMLERADKVSRLLDMKYCILLRSPEEVGTSFDHIQWGAVLRSASALKMFCKRHGRISPRGVIRFLMLDREFPRSMRFCLRAVRESLHRIAGARQGAFRPAPEKLLGQMCSELESATVDDILRRGLHEYVDQFQTNLNLAAQAIFERFFALKPPPASNAGVGAGLLSHA